MTCSKTRESTTKQNSAICVLSKQPCMRAGACACVRACVRACVAGVRAGHTIMYSKSEASDRPRALYPRPSMSSGDHATQVDTCDFGTAVRSAALVALMILT